MVNLIHNAIQYSDKKTKVKIEGYVKERAIFIGQDSGIGIEVNEIENIFRDFIALISLIVKKLEGLVWDFQLLHIINLHNGKIEVQSKIGKGSEFILIIPGMIKKIIGLILILNFSYSSIEISGDARFRPRYDIKEY